MKDLVLIQIAGEIYLVKAEDVNILECKNITVTHGTIKDTMKSIHAICLDQLLKIRDETP